MRRVGDAEDERMGVSDREEEKQPPSAAGSRPRRGVAAFASAKMLEAQRSFQKVVKQELETLLARGAKREDAVKLLLHRIVPRTDTPEASAVRGVMRQFQMNYDDAVRALIVKQELGRLKRKGLDSFAAIEELTRKMQRVGAEGAGAVARQSSQEEEKETDKDADEAEQAVKRGEVEDATLQEEKEGESLEKSSRCSEEEKKEAGREDAKAEEAGDDEEAKAEVSQETKADEEQVAASDAAEIASPTFVETDKDGNDSAVSLCQRIGQVSISSSSVSVARGLPKAANDGDEVPPSPSQEEEAEEDEHTEGEDTASPARIRSPRATASGSSSSSSSSLLDLTPQTRKRRAAALGVQFSSSVDSNSNSGGRRNVQPLFPSLKKQKLRAEVGDGFLQVVARKAKTASMAAGPPGSSSSGGGGGELAVKNLLKRQRVSSSGMQDDEESPIAEELSVSVAHHRHHHLHHHSKRHKSGRLPSQGRGEEAA